MAAATHSARPVSRFVKDSINTFALGILNRAFGIVVGIVLARELGPVGKGYIAYAPIGLELCTIAIGGVAQAVTFQFGRNGLPGGAVHAAMTRIVLAFSIPATIVLALVAWLIPSQHVLAAAAVALPFALYVTATTGLLIGADNISATNVQRTILASAFNLATLAAIFIWHADYRAVLVVWVLSYVAAALYSYAAVRPHIADRTPPTRAIVREQAVFGGTTGVAQLAGYVNMRVDVIIVSFVLGAHALGLYTVAVGFAEMLWQLSMPLCNAAFPRIATGESAQAAAFTAKLIRHIVALVVPLAIVCFFLAPPLIARLYGEAFAPSAGALRWILPGVTAYAVEVPLGYYLIVRLARPGAIIAIQSASIVVCAALTLATVHRFGIEGAAAATSVTYLGVVAIKGWIFLHETRTPLSALVRVNGDDLRALTDLVRRLGLRLARA